MRTVKEVKQEEVKQEFNLKEAFVLWKQKSERTGAEYLTGKTSDEAAVKLRAFFNTNKKSPKQPDITIYTNDEKGERLEVASLWENVSEETGKRYLTGSTNEKEKLVGFYTKVEDEKRPYIRVYYKQD